MAVRNRTDLYYVLPEADSSKSSSGEALSARSKKGVRKALHKRIAETIIAPSGHRGHLLRREIFNAALRAAAKR